jgi:hypothetical protein
MLLDEAITASMPEINGKFAERTRNAQPYLRQPNRGGRNDGPREASGSERDGGGRPDKDARRAKRERDQRARGGERIGGGERTEDGGFVMRDDA